MKHFKQYWTKSSNGQFLIFIFLFTLFFYTQLYAGTVRGKVVDLSTNQPIPLVNLIMKDIDRYCVSDSIGYFEIINIPAELHVLEIRHVAYKSKYHVFSIRQDDTLNFMIELEPEIIELEGVDIYSKAEEKEKIMRPYHKTVINNEEIKKTGAINLTDVIKSYAPGVFDISSRRRSYGRSSLDRPQFIIYLDDSYVQNIPGSLDNIIDVSQIERIEISRWVGAAPNIGPGTSDRVLRIYTKKQK